MMNWRRFYVARLGLARLGMAGHDWPRRGRT